MADMLIVDAIVFTINRHDEIIPNGAVLVRDGRIEAAPQWPGEPSEATISLACGLVGLSPYGSIPSYITRSAHLLLDADTNVSPAYGNVTLRLPTSRNL